MSSSEFPKAAAVSYRNVQAGRSDEKCIVVTCKTVTCLPDASLTTKPEGRSEQPKRSAAITTSSAKWIDTEDLDFEVSMAKIMPGTILAHFKAQASTQDNVLFSLSIDGSEHEVAG